MNQLSIFNLQSFISNIDISNTNFSDLNSIIEFIGKIVYSTNEMDLFSQFFLLWLSVTIFTTIGYYLACSFSYLIFYQLFNNYFHPPNEPQPFKGQPKLEILMSLKAIPWLSVLTVPFFMLELHGYSQLYWYSPIEGESLLYNGIVIIAFLLFTDCCIYWIHRWEHTFPFLYKYIHKPHHKWLVPTPFAALAFHPLDGWAQALPYHIFVFVIPMNVKLYITLFIIVQGWSINIHDGIDAVGSRLGTKTSHIVNGSLHHYIHHTRFNYNYGQYLTLWDRIMNTHYDPKIDFDSGDFSLPKQNYHPGMHPSERNGKKQN
jgi:lathosterol oxidase